ncbi:head-tail connector protein [Novosphingobium olei]|uniref:head-tail connector protein n=1 Tax=Novosphingobium olei TaxID=2728851 RepID=UPI00308CBE3C|nr:phage head-tail connector protein [Novosphingobium olei]
MKRAIVAPPSLAPAALSELKAWLGITTGRDDAELTALLMAALDLCEGFTGTMPLQAGCEEVLAAAGDWQTLGTRPIQAMTGAARIALTGQRTALLPGDYEFDIGADGSGRFRLKVPVAETRIAVTFTAGLAATWSALPDPLRHGIMRLAAHEHRQRDAQNTTQRLAPPAAVAALWRPWRSMRLA